MSDKDRLDDLEGQTRALMNINALILKKLYQSEKERKRLLQVLTGLTGEKLVERSTFFNNGYTETARNLIKLVFGARGRDE